MTAPHALSATEAVAAIEAGSLTAEALTRSCLERIAEREERVQAWVALDRDQALMRARQLDKGLRRGPLHGLPLGIKDIIETHDLPTECGSPIYKGYRSGRDAAVVALCRAAGAVILGKTVTTEFAFRHPGKTRNPHDPSRTPGGSSSGSAAGIADRMMAGAFGTQTGGSILRPASYCGIVGFKPSYNAVPTAGVKPLSPTLDTVGPMTRTVADAILLFSVIACDRWAVQVEPTLPKRVGVCRTPAWPEVEPASAQALEEAARRLKAKGCEVIERELPDSMREIHAVHQVAMEWEGFTALGYERTAHADKLSQPMREMLAGVARYDAIQFQAALRRAGEWRSELDRLFDEVDLLLTPAAPGEAPQGLGSTGKAVFNAPWTLLHVPCITLPGLAGPSGLPVGVQFVARRGQDNILLAYALALEALLKG